MAGEKTPPPPPARPVTDPSPHETAVPPPPGDVTLVEALGALRREGYTSDFLVGDDGQLCCGACAVCQPPPDVRVDRWRRLEGASDPGDMAAIIAVSCPSCAQSGTAVLRYGPEAGPGDAELLRQLRLGAADASAGPRAARRD